MTGGPTPPPRPPAPPRAYSDAVSGSNSVPPPIPPKVPLPGSTFSKTASPKTKSSVLATDDLVKSLGSVSSASFFASSQGGSGTAATSRARATTLPSSLSSGHGSSASSSSTLAAQADVDEILEVDSDADELMITSEPALPKRHANKEGVWHTGPTVKTTYGSSKRSQRGAVVSHFRPAASPPPSSPSTKNTDEADSDVDPRWYRPWDLPHNLEPLKKSRKHPEHLHSPERDELDEAPSCDPNPPDIPATSGWDDSDDDAMLLRSSSTVGRTGGVDMMRYDSARARGWITPRSQKGLAGEGLNAGWTAPKVIEIRNEPEQEGGIWGEDTVWDFGRIEDVVAEEGKWKAMGTVCETVVAAPTLDEAPPSEVSMSDTPAAPKPSAGEDTAMNESTPPTDAPASPVPPPPPPKPASIKRTFRTITREELDTARPHPHLYFCVRNFSWVLFAPAEAEASPFTAHDGHVPLWFMADDRGDELAFQLEPLLPIVIPPARPDKLSQLSSYDSDEQSSPIGQETLTCIKSWTSDCVVFSPTKFWPTVIPAAVMQRLIEAKRADPPVGQTPDVSVLKAVNMIFSPLSNLLFKGETRSVPVTGKTFGTAMGWNDLAQGIFIGFLGFTFDEEARTITPPLLDEKTEEGREHRVRCLRCWLELSIWISDFRKKRSESELGGYKTSPARLELLPARPRLLKTLNHVDLPTVPKQEVWTTSGSLEAISVPLAKAYHYLGVTSDMADQVLDDVYGQQSAQWPNSIPVFLDAIQVINEHRRTDTLQLLIARERSKGHVTKTDFENAYRELRLPGDSYAAWNRLEDEVIAEAFARRQEEVTHPERKRILKEAMDLIVRDRKSDFLTVIASTAGGDDAAPPKMDLERAARLLEIPPDSSDDTVILAVFNMKINDTPQQKSTLTEALRVIGEHLDSQHIRNFLKDGVKEDVNAGWETGPAVAADIPVGLTNIANTCYLNSLLQYFFTIRELREAILTFSKEQATEVEASNRVGGRLVTQAEVDRSRRFIELLQGLFNQLITAPVAAVTPATELAYLALVPSKEESAAKDTATLTEIKQPPPPPVGSPVDTSPSANDGAKSPSVLGKRRQDQLDKEADLLDLNPMDIDSQSPSRTGEPESPASPNPMQADEDRSSKRGRSVDDGTSGGAKDLVAMADAPHRSAPSPEQFLLGGLAAAEDASTKESAAVPARVQAPPLPPRPVPNKADDLEKQVSNYMAFGRQNDVTECMDNVMFQIECALKPTASEGDSPSAAEVLKRTFYGKTRQELVFEDTTTPEPVRAKEEPFFSLLVDVAEEGRDVYDGLDAVFDDSPVEIEGKAARRRVSLVEVPALLQIQLQRVQYDREEKKIFKSNQHMSFGPEISMDRYLEPETGDEDAKRRKLTTSQLREEMEGCRSRLRKLQEPKGTDPCQLLRNTIDHLANQPDLADVLTSELAEDTIAEAQEIQAELDQLVKRIRELKQEIEALWADQHRAEYELVSVFIHRGTALSGHYFIYQRDSKNPKRWLKYNDSVVTDIDAAEHVFRETTGDTNAYFLVYCRKDRLDAIESIARRF